MTVIANRRTGAVAAATLLAALVLTACETEVQGQNTNNGRELRPSQVATPPAFAPDVPELNR